MRKLLTKWGYWLCAAMVMPVIAVVCASTSATNNLAFGNLYLWGDADGLVSGLSFGLAYSLAPFIIEAGLKQSQPKGMIIKFIAANIVLYVAILGLCAAASSILPEIYVVPLLISQALGAFVAAPVSKSATVVRDFGESTLPPVPPSKIYMYAGLVFRVAFVGLWIFLIYKDVSENGPATAVYCLAALAGWGIGKAFWDKARSPVK
ncbi:MAG: hypothetical protein QM667_09560 [Asticcacaulis sp.]